MSFIETALSESFMYYKSRVDHDIERNRKGNFHITVNSTVDFKKGSSCDAVIEI